MAFSHGNDAVAPELSAGPATPATAAATEPAAAAAAASTTQLPGIQHSQSTTANAAGSGSAGGNRLSHLLDGNPSATQAQSPLYGAKAGQSVGSATSAVIKQQQHPGMADRSGSPDSRAQTHSSPVRPNNSSGGSSGLDNSATANARNHTPPSTSTHHSNLQHQQRRYSRNSIHRRSGSGSEEPTPPSLRQTHSETPSHSHNGSGSIRGGGGSSTSSQHDDASKASYALWLPWEETQLIDWLYEPNNCKMFNEPRRKKDCHERIIREVLPNKTSRAIEGKIRTLEKRYLKADSETRRPDFAIKHPGKRPDEVAEALCNSFHKLQAIFNPVQARSFTIQQQHQQQQNTLSSSASSPWAAAAGRKGAADSEASPRALPAPLFEHGARSPTVATNPAAIAAAAGSGSYNGNSTGNNNSSSSSSGGGGILLSVPRTTPPRITSAESLPYHAMSNIRKIAPKRGADGESVDNDGPPMFAGSKRSRTFPTMPHNHRSPAHHPHNHQHQHQQQQQQHEHQHQHQHQHQRIPSASQQPQRSPLLLQVQQQQARYYEGSQLDMSGRPASTTISMMPMPSPIAPMPTPHAIRQQQQQQQAMGPAKAGVGMDNPTMPTIREPEEPGQLEASSSLTAVRGSREELEWLQLNLRREELTFRQTVFAHERELETKRIELEERRLDMQKMEAEVEKARLEAQRQQMDAQLGTLASLSGALTQMVGQLGVAISAFGSSQNQQQPRRRQADGGDSTSSSVVSADGGASVHAE